jgi:hypothetical protein
MPAIKRGAIEKGRLPSAQRPAHTLTAQSEACITFASPGGWHEFTTDQACPAVSGDLRRVLYRRLHCVHATSRVWPLLPTASPLHRSVRQFCGTVKPCCVEPMTTRNPTHVAHCRCGAVEIRAWGQPIMVNACYCDDCQAAAHRLAGSASSEPASGTDGGTEFMVFRRDRIACTGGSDRLQAMRLTAPSKTRRMIASCCATPMYLAFDDKRPWVSAFRVPFGTDAPPLEMRICTRFKRSEEKAEDGLPSHPGYPPAMMVRILAVWPLMLFSRPVGALP